jgi:hypothetical protein
VKPKKKVKGGILDAQVVEELEREARKPDPPPTFPAKVDGRSAVFRTSFDRTVWMEAWQMVLAYKQKDKKHFRASLNRMLEAGMKGFSK